MTPHDRLRISLAAARYLEALEQSDQATLDALWEQAAADTELLAAFREIHAGILEEETARSTKDVQSTIVDAVEKHMPSAEVVRPAGGPVTVADVACELFQYTPGRLTAEAHQMNERLRAYQDELPENIGLSSLIAWAEAKFGSAPVEYWNAFRDAAHKVRMRVNTDVDFQTAARRTKSRPEGSK